MCWSLQDGDWGPPPDTDRELLRVTTSGWNQEATRLWGSAQSINFPCQVPGWIQWPECHCPGMLRDTWLPSSSSCRNYRHSREMTALATVPSKCPVQPLSVPRPQGMGLSRAQERKGPQPHLGAGVSGQGVGCLLGDTSTEVPCVRLARALPSLTLRYTGLKPTLQLILSVQRCTGLDAEHSEPLLRLAESGTGTVS